MTEFGAETTKIGIPTGRAVAENGTRGICVGGCGVDELG